MVLARYQRLQNTGKNSYNCRYGQCITQGSITLRACGIIVRAIGAIAGAVRVGIGRRMAIRAAICVGAVIYRSLVAVVCYRVC